jgi:aminoglycoside phosphotransferase (APT) family kinase protein
VIPRQQQGRIRARKPSFANNRPGSFDRRTVRIKPLAVGEPAADYRFTWSVYSWLEGEPATAEHIADLGQAATDLAQFVAALQRVDLEDGPPPGEHNSFRGVPLATRDEATRAAIASLGGTIDSGR